VRLFLAINLPATVRQQVLDATAPLRAVAPRVSWADESKLHLTLKFLGEQPDEIVEPLRQAVDDVSRTHRQFAMRVEGVGAFPNFRRARVVWIGIAADPRLELLHHDLEVACERLGFAVEGRPFRPHLTLARVRDDTGEDVLRQLARAGKQITYAGEFAVRSVDLMRSVLRGSTGARYECLHDAPLRTT
jgi:RNA 2',3'-cyclic 3'-phosphodiesterase